MVPPRILVSSYRDVIVAPTYPLLTPSTMIYCSQEAPQQNGATVSLNLPHCEGDKSSCPHNYFLLSHGFGNGNRKLANASSNPPSSRPSCLLCIASCCHLGGEKFNTRTSWKQSIQAVAPWPWKEAALRSFPGAFSFSVIEYPGLENYSLRERPISTASSKEWWPLLPKSLMSCWQVIHF